jgi:flagellar hook-length control protein FliK
LQQTQPHGGQSASAAHLTPQGKADGTHAQAGGFPGSPIATPVTEQISLQVRKALDDGNNRIRIKMQPASLGQVEVRMEVGHDGSLKAVVAADKHETFEWLQRDARSLERALQESGFKTDSNSLSFQYRGGEGGQQRSFAEQQQRFEAARNRAVLDATVSITTEAPVRSSVATGRLDLSV